MKLALFNKPTENVVLLSLVYSGEEAELRVVDSIGNYRYSLLGIRPDGAFVSYSGDKKLKDRDGFKTNTHGQLVHFHDSKEIDIGKAVS